MILGICDTPKVMEIMNIIVKIIKIIKIVIPIILLFVLMFKFIKAATSGNDDAIAVIKKKAIPNIITAALIFIVPTLVSLIMTLVFPDSGFTKCITLTPKENINNKYVEKIEVLVDRAIETENINDYVNAKLYLNNIEDEVLVEKYESKLQEVYDIIDYKRKSKGIYGENTGYGSDIATTRQIEEACKWVLHPDDIKIRLQTCIDQHQYKDPNESLPGGAVTIMTNGVVNYGARKTITYKEYQLGLFGGEIDFRFNATFNRMFAIMYKDVILNSLLWRMIARGDSTDYSQEYTYTAGSCAQNYKQYLIDERYHSGKYKEIIDAAVDSTRYLILVDKDTGNLTEVRYNLASGILPVMDKASKSNDIEGILEAMKSGHDLAFRYKTSVLYDCRNLLTDEDIAIEAARQQLNMPTSE